MNCLLLKNSYTVDVLTFPGLQRYPKLLSELDQEFGRVVPPELMQHNDTVTQKIAESIRAFYFQQNPVDLRNIDSLIDVSLY